MNSSTEPFKAPATRRTQLRVPLDEMHRLMRVYGSTKCLRKRRSAVGGANAKEESVRRKFYRWFPDLDERFAKDSAGFWRPKFGHEVEMRHRDELRRKDGKVTYKKRATAKMRTQDRRRRFGGAEAPAPTATVEGSGAERAAEPFVASASGGDERDFERAEIASASGREEASTVEGCNPVPAAPPPVAQPRFDQELTMMVGTNASIIEVSTLTGRNPVATMEGADASIIEDDEALYISGIFDDVERSFYGACPGLASSSSCGSASSGDALDASMAEYCEEVLASGGEEGASVFRFDGL